MSTECKCVAGKGGACSHIAAILFYVEDIKRRDVRMLPHDRTVTDTLQQWHVPLKKCNSYAISNISFQKPAYGITPQVRVFRKSTKQVVGWETHIKLCSLIIVILESNIGLLDVKPKNSCSSAATFS